MEKICFGTGGFRAIIGEDFTKDNVQKICQALSNIIIEKNKKKQICIGYDNRFMSETFAIWCSEVFAGNGISVELFDRATSTPVVMYATKLNNYDFGIMITASHNPYMYNGVKVFVGEGRDASLEDTALIEQEIQKVKEVKSIDYKEGLKTYIRLADYLQSYVANIVSLLKLNNVCDGLNVVFDTKHGSTVDEINCFAENIGLKQYKIINSKRDAFFDFKAPAPNENNIEELTAEVLKDNASIGFALDADGDRLAVIDEKGNYIDNNYILAIAYYYLAKVCRNAGNSVKNIATSNLLNLVTEKCGHKCYEVPVGFKFVSGAIKEHNAVVGGESSGGLAIQGHIWGKDSLLAIAICIKAMADMKKSFSEILQEVKTFVGGYNKIILDKELSYSKKQKEVIDNKLFEQKLLPKHKFEVQKIDISNYVKIYYKNGNWSLVRFSGTEPILRIFAEADTKAQAEELILDWQQFLDLGNK